MSQTLTLACISQRATRMVPSVVATSNTLTRTSQQRIRSSKYAEVRTIKCEVRDRILFLRGQVSSFFLKQLAQEAVRSVEGIGYISNYVEVAYPDSLAKANSDRSQNDGHTSTCRR